MTVKEPVFGWFPLAEVDKLVETATVVAAMLVKDPPSYWVKELESALAAFGKGKTITDPTQDGRISHEVDRGEAIEPSGYVIKGDGMALVFDQKGDAFRQLADTVTPGMTDRIWFRTAVTEWIRARSVEDCIEFCRWAKATEARGEGGFEALKPGQEPLFKFERE